jgi:hypothetical protein
MHGNGEALRNLARDMRLPCEMQSLSLKLCAAAASLLFAAGMASAQLRGHGGPVRALAV